MAGTFGDTVEESAAFVKEMAAVVDAVVIIVSKLATPDEGDDVLLARLQQLVELTPGVPLGLYECPAPYHRLLSMDALAWIASSGRFLFLKDTCRNNDQITARLALLKTIKSPFRWFNGNVTTMLHSLQQGATPLSTMKTSTHCNSHVLICSPRLIISCARTYPASIGAELSAPPNCVR